MNLSTTALEDELQLRPFGKWARSENNLRRLQCVDSPMFREFKSGWPETRELIPDIDPDYAMKLDKLMTRLDKFDRDVVVFHYVGLQSFRSIAKALRTTDRNVRDVRDRALSFIYGMLQST